MSELTDKYNSIASKQNKTIKAITDGIKESLPFLILLMNIVVVVLSRLFRTGFQNPFTADFFVELFMNMLTTMVCYSCFVKYGEKNEKLESSAYANNVKRWQEISGIVRTQSSERFILYCKKQVDIERNEMRHFYILNYTMITSEEYERDYKKLTDLDIDRLVEQGQLRFREARYIKKANAICYLKPINPLLILCGVNKMNLNDVGRDGIDAATMAIMTRPLMMFALTTVVTMFSGYWEGIKDASVLFDIIYSAMMVVVASITGYSAGADAGRKEHDKIKGRIFFLERYLAEEAKTEQNTDGQS